jgi:hypothetical protein
MQLFGENEREEGVRQTKKGTCTKKKRKQGQTARSANTQNPLKEMQQTAARRQE